MTNPPEVIRDTVPLSDMEPWRQEFVRAAVAAGKEDEAAKAIAGPVDDYRVDWASGTYYPARGCVIYHGADRYISCWHHDFISGDDFHKELAAEKWQIFPIPPDPKTYFMGEFAMLLAVKGVLVDYQTLEQLADIAIGDV
jgi:hypothetical protein